MPKTNAHEDVELTADEAKALEGAFKDESFRKLMAEYVSEISDPKNREESEAYISQLEAQNEVPVGKALVRPSSGFVVKCMHTKKRDGCADQSKLFLNIVHSESTDEPTADMTELNGSNWTVPYALGPVRMECDKSNNLVPTFDCCFHPLSLKFAHDRQEFLDLLVNIAKDAVGVAFANAGDEVEIHSGYKILRGTSYKNGTPKALLVASDKQSHKPNTTADSVLPRSKDEETAQIITSIIDAVDKDNDSTEVITPKYKLVEQGVFDLADHTTATHAPVSKRCPKQLVVRIDVEKAKSAADINLDVSERKLVIKPEPPKCCYELEVNLPYSVNPQKGSARFEKMSGSLVVTLPVMA